MFTHMNTGLNNKQNQNKVIRHEIASVFWMW